jgi:hypothetical protein
MEQFKPVNEDTQVAKKTPSQLNKDRINKESAKLTKKDRDKTFVKNMDKIIKGKDDFQTVAELKYDSDSITPKEILDKNAGAVAEDKSAELGKGGMQEINYDSKPEGFDKRSEGEIDPVKGKRVYANSVATDLGSNINKLAKKQIKAKEKEPMYVKDTQPVKVVKENKNKSSKLIKGGSPIKDRLDESTLSDLNKIKHLFEYKPSEYMDNTKKKVIKK